MLKVKTNELESKYFAGLLELGNFKTSGKIAYNCAKNINVFEGAIADWNKTRTLILSSHAKKDAKGQAVIEGTEYVFENDEDKQKAIKAVEEALLVEVELRVFDFPLSDIMDIKDITHLKN